MVATPGPPGPTTVKLEPTYLPVETMLLVTKLYSSTRLSRIVPSPENGYCSQPKIDLPCRSIRNSPCHISRNRE